MRRSFNSPPVSVGEELDVRVEAVGEKGDGVAKVKGFVLFVPGTQAGENCKVRVTKVLQKVGFAEKIGGASEGASESSSEGSSSNEEQESDSAPEDTEDFGEETNDSNDSSEESSEEGSDEE